MGYFKKNSVDRRDFLKGSAASVAALVAGNAAAGAQDPTTKSKPSVPPPKMSEEAETGNPLAADVLTTDRPGSDFMVDVIKSLGIEYICANPGSTFRGLHESIINYGSNKNPELITCCHEETSVGMAHGYFKVEGKPLGVFVHSTVGLQHASMAIYNAYCDRVPVYIVAGNVMDETKRRPGVEWDHTAQDQAVTVRDFLKWDDSPASLTHFADSAVRAYKIAMTPPMEPVLLVADGELQENPVPEGASLHVPKLTLTSPPQGDSGAVAEAARLLVAAESPLLVADLAARTSAGMTLLVQLAEALQAPLIDLGGRMNFPTRHPLNHTYNRRALIGDADVVLALEVGDFWGTVNTFRDQLNRTSMPITRENVKLISITADDLYLKSNYQDFQRYTEVDLAIAADAEATLPSLIEAVKRQTTPDRSNILEQRGKSLATAHQELLETARKQAAYAWMRVP